MLLIGEGLLALMIDCPTPWRHISSPHVPDPARITVLGDYLLSFCMHCKQQVVTNVTVPLPVGVEAFMKDMTLGYLWAAQPKQYLIREEPDVEDLL